MIFPCSVSLSFQAISAAVPKRPWFEGRCGEREFICQSSASPALPPPSSPLFPAHTQEVLCCGSLRSVLCFLATAACCFSLSSVCACEHVMSHAQESEKILFRHAHSEKPWKLNEGVSVNKTTFFWG